MVKWVKKNSLLKKWTKRTKIMLLIIFKFLYFMGNINLLEGNIYLFIFCICKNSLVEMKVRRQRKRRGDKK